MSKVWYCTNCGYEVTSRGRCHACGEKLVASKLAALSPLGEDDEVGYRIGDWEDWERGRLIVALNELEILHRFEDDELVVAAEDEARVDDLVSELTARPAESAGESREDGAGFGEGGSQAPENGPDAAMRSSVRALAHAAGRLRADPTDMQADADVAEASTAIFFAEGYPGMDDDTWAAVGRVTRRLLSALGAEEALDDAIRSEASVLAKLLEPVVGDGPPESLVAADANGSVEPEAGGAESLDGDEEDEGEDDESEDDEDEDDTDESGQTVYELPEWLPEQRAQLGVLLEESAIEYEWEHDDLVVPSDREADVEALFAQVGGPLGAEGDDDGGEGRYHAIEELFAATGRLAGDPADEERAAAVLTWVEEVDGPPPLGMDEVHWLRIMNRAHGLSQAIEDGVPTDLIRDEASALHSLLRTVV
jgi:hypothetical protein